MPKKDIHPKWYDEAKVFCDGQLVMTVGSTRPEIKCRYMVRESPFLYWINKHVRSGRQS